MSQKGPEIVNINSVKFTPVASASTPFKIVNAPPEPISLTEKQGQNLVLTASKFVTDLYDKSYFIQGIVVVAGLLILAALVYFRKSINIGGAFSFLNSIPLSVVLVAFGASIVAVMIVVMFYFEYGNNSWVYWLGFPALIYITSFAITVMNQALSAGFTDMGAAASASTNPLVAGLAGLVIGGSAYARAPVVSAFPVINTVRVVDDVLSLEQMNPVMKGIGVSYWVWWLLFISMMAAMGKAAVNKS